MAADATPAITLQVRRRVPPQITRQTTPTESPIPLWHHDHRMCRMMHPMQFRTLAHGWPGCAGGRAARSGGVPLRDSRGGNRELPHLLWLEAPGFTLSEAWTFGHAPGYRTGVRMSGSAWMTAERRDSCGLRKHRHLGPGWFTRQCGQTSSVTSLLDPTWCLSMGGSR